MKLLAFTDLSRNGAKPS